MNLTTSISITTNTIRKTMVAPSGSATYYLLDGPDANNIVDGGGNSIIWRLV